MNKNLLQNIKDNQSGIALLLVILILSSLLVTMITISSIALRVGRGANQIKNSEIAYFTAESFVEKTLYEIERNRSIDITGLDDGLDIEGTQGEVTISENTQVTQITNLAASESYQLELDFTGLDLPNKLNVSCSQNAKMVYLKSSGTQDEYENCQDINSLEAGILRVINESGGSNTVTIEAQNGNDVFTTGITITAIGKYRQQERRLEVERTNWRVY